MAGLREETQTPIEEQLAAIRPITDFYLGGTGSEGTLRFSHRTGMGRSIEGRLFSQREAFGVELDIRWSQPIIPEALLIDISKKIDELRSPDKPVSIRLHGGTYLRGATQELISFANQIGKPVSTEYNGIPLTISSEDTVAEVFDRYRTEQRRKRASEETSTPQG